MLETSNTNKPAAIDNKTLKYFGAESEIRIITVASAKDEYLNKWMYRLLYLRDTIKIKISEKISAV